MVNKDHRLHDLLACTVMDEDIKTARMLAVGDGRDCSFVIACRDDANREQIDATLLPDGSIIEADSDGLLPQHPALLIRSYENVQMMLDPRTARIMAQWLLAAADWLEETIGDG